MVYHFIDNNGNKVSLVFGTSFQETPGHVWVVCRYENQWLLTKHPKRGLEFPGGKIERGESPDAAAIREVYEETGGRITSLVYIGQYIVYEPKRTIIKNIYYGLVTNVETKIHYEETDGPVLVPSLPEDIVEDVTYSFIMKDEVLKRSFEQIRRKRLI